MTTTVRLGALVVTADDKRTRQVVATPHFLQPTADLFVTNLRGQDDYYTFARLTGRTRRMWGMDCPTVEMYEVETSVVPNPDTTSSFAHTLMGTPGARIPGIWITRPENLSTVLVSASTPVS